MSKLKMRKYLKRSKLNKVGKGDTPKCKQRIQKLLTTLVRIIDGGCIFRNYPETGACAGYTAADHLITRAKNVSYGELWNVICVCTRHHIWWKPQNPIEYNRIVKDYVGEERWAKIERTLADRKLYTMGIYEWQKIELFLKKELEKYDQ